MGADNNDGTNTIDSQAPNFLVELPVLNGCCTIILGRSKSHNTLVDSDSYATLSQWAWGVTGSKGSGHPNAGTRYYAHRTEGPAKASRSIRLHHEVLRLAGVNIGQSNFVDHRNRDSLDNRRENLRPATPGQNRINSRRFKSKSRSKYTGVTYSGGRWVARITKGGKFYSLGAYDVEEDAARAYDRAAVRFHGEFACINGEIPEETADTTAKVVLFAAQFKPTADGAEAMIKIPNTVPPSPVGTVTVGAWTRYLFVSDRAMAYTKDKKFEPLFPE